MTDVQEPTQEELEQAAAFDALKLKADRLGIGYNHKTKFGTLQGKVSAALAADDEKEEEEEKPKGRKPVGNLRETDAMRKMRMRKDANLLIRCRVTCHNPDKGKWEGELISVSNQTASAKLFVPFGVETHIPQIVFNYLEERMFSAHLTKKGDKGRDVNYQKQRKEFAIERLAPLTLEELKELAHQQAMTAEKE